MRLKMLFLFPLLLPLWAAAGTSAKRPPPPYVFNLGGLSARQVEALKKVPGVVKVAPNSGRVRVVWQPFKADAGSRFGYKWIKGTRRIYDFFVLKGRIGKTQWTHGGLTTKPAGTIIPNTLYGVAFGVMFDDQKLGSNEVLALYCFNQAIPGQVEHEMLRDIAGTNVSIEKCGPGYVVVSRTGRGVAVVWQVSTQMFVRIDNSYDKEMVAAYVKRLGSIIPKDYKISVDKWVENEIRWRLPMLFKRYKWDQEYDGKDEFLFVQAPYVTSAFPDVFRKFGIVKPSSGMSILKKWRWLTNTTAFLWANRKNFKYDDRGRGYVLKGKDLYDPKNPPELPPELRPPPKPEEVRKPTPTKKPAPAKTP